MSLILALVLAQAQAGRIDIEFDHRMPDEGPVAGTGDWWSGSADPWEGWRFDGLRWARPTQDGGGGTFGSGDGSLAENWLINDGLRFIDGFVFLQGYVEDDDTFGVLLDFQGPTDFTAFLLVGGTYAERDDGEGTLSPIPLDAPSASIVRVQGGVAEVLTTEPYAFAAEQRLKVGAGRQDDQVWLRVWADYDDPWDEAELVLTASDPSPTEPGAAGIYAYDMGNADEPAIFGQLIGWKYDQDDDLIADDDDNCEFVANASQADGDGDGVGAACDEDELPDEEPEDTGSPADSGEPDSEEDPSQDDPDEEVNASEDGLTQGAPQSDNSELGACSTGGAAPVGGLALLALAATRRRQR